MLSVRYIGNLLIQLISVLLLFLYAYYVYPMDPFSVYCLLCALALVGFGRWRPAYDTMIASLTCIVLYAGSILYRMLTEVPSMEITWNELVWLLAFPFYGMIGGLNRDSRRSGEEDALSFLYPRDAADPEQEEPVIVDEQLSYLSSTAFLYKLEEDVIQSLREKRPFHLLLMSVEHLDKYARLFGTDQAQILLNLIAEAFNEHCDGTRSQIGKYALAGIMHEEDRAAVETAQRALSDKLYEIMQTRPRKETIAQLKLKFGVAACPIDGIEASALLDKAKAEWTWSGVDTKEDTFS